MEPNEPTELPAPKTTVLIVSYNCLPALERCLEALEASEQRDTFEIRVMDCASADGSGTVDQQFPGAIVRRLPRNFGKTKARNIGARSAKGEYLLLLEPDVAIQPGTVAALTSHLDANPDTLAAVPLLASTSGEPVSRCGPLPHPSELYRSWRAREPWYRTIPRLVPEQQAAIQVECPDPGAVLIRTQTVRAMNYFDERYGEFGSDLELHTQAFRASKKIEAIPSIRALCRRGEGLWSPQNSTAESALTADYGIGLVAYTAKHYGWLAGFRLKTRMIFHALMHFRFGLLSQLLNGQKIDGSQRAL